MESIMLSIRPEYVAEILNGEKTIEVRKTRPKIKTPFKVYIYCAKSPFYEYISLDDYGKVVAEFICDEIKEYKEHYEEGGYYYTLTDNEKMQLDSWELANYGKGKILYGWHISNLKIYDNLKELTDFHNFKREDEYWIAHTLKQSPKDWCYIWENKND